MDKINLGSFSSNITAPIGRGSRVWILFGQSWSWGNNTFSIYISSCGREFPFCKFLFIRCRGIYVLRHFDRSANPTRLDRFRYGARSGISSASGWSGFEFTKHAGYKKCNWNEKDCCLCQFSCNHGNNYRDDIWSDCRIKGATARRFRIEDQKIAFRCSYVVYTF